MVNHTEDFQAWRNYKNQANLITRPSDIIHNSVEDWYSRVESYHKVSDTYTSQKTESCICIYPTSYLKTVYDFVKPNWTK